MHEEGVKSENGKENKKWSQRKWMNVCAVQKKNKTNRKKTSE